VIVPATARIDESLVGDMRPRRQFERAAIIDGGLDRRVVEKGVDVKPKLGVPLAARSLRVTGAGALDDRGIERRVNRCASPATTSTSGASTPK
jgi:hypothetical protein